MSKIQRRSCVLPVLVLLFMLIQPVCFAYESTGDITVPETLTIKVGYFGEEFHDKATITRAELERMEQYEGCYSYITSVGTVMLQYAKGPTVKSVLEYAGIATDSVSYLNFWCADMDDSPFISSKSKSALLDVTAYYFPNLRDNWSGGAVTDEAAATAGAVLVPAIMAVREYSTKSPNIIPTAADMTVNNSFRLCAGQLDVSAVTSFDSAKWINRIDVQLDGSPPEDVTDEELTKTTSAQITPVAPETATTIPHTERREETSAPHDETKPPVTEHSTAGQTAGKAESTSVRTEISKPVTNKQETTAANSLTQAITTVTAAYSKNEETTSKAVKSYKFREISVRAAGAQDGGIIDTGNTVKIKDTERLRKLAGAYCIIVFLMGAAYRVKRYRQEL